MAKRKNTFSDEIRRAILAAPMSRYKMFLATDIDQACLSRFVNGKAGLELAAVDKLADLLDLHVTIGRKAKAPAKGKGKTKG